jgi:hypothetical protein
VDPFDLTLHFEDDSTVTLRVHDDGTIEPNDDKRVAAGIIAIKGCRRYTAAGATIVRYIRYHTDVPLRAVQGPIDRLDDMVSFAESCDSMCRYESRVEVGLDGSIKSRMVLTRFPDAPIRTLPLMDPEGKRHVSLGKFKRVIYPEKLE